MKIKLTTSEIKKIDELSDYLKLLGEPNRLKIIHLLKNGELCVCQIIDFLGLPQNLISHHLAVLKKLKLVSSRKDGVKIFYRLKKTEISRLTTLINKFLNL